MDLYLVFWIAAVVLLVVEVLAGMTLGVALSAAISLFVLGILNSLGFLVGMNIHLLVGVLVFAASTWFVLKYFRGRARQSERDRDVNDY